MKILFALLISLTFISCGGNNDGSAPALATSTLTITGGVQASFLPNYLEADTGINPTNFKLKIYKIGFSTDPGCSNPTVFNISDNPSYTDFMNDPTLGSGSLPNGTYNCVIVEFQSYIKFTPADNSDTGNCTGGSEETMDVCQTGFTSTLLSGATTTCSTNNDDRITLYMTTAGYSGADCNNCGFVPNNGTLLQSALVVAGSKSSTFYSNALGTIEDSGGNCQMDEPGWGFE